MHRLLLIVLFFASLCSCNSPEPSNTGRHSLLAVNDIDQYAPPAPGTIVTADSVPVTDDPLNHFTFSVRIKTNEYSKNGTYSIEAAYGPNEGNGMFTMPRGGGNLKPILQRGSNPHVYIIGFKYQGKFYEYYSVTGSKSAIEIKNTKAYSFQ